MSLAPSPRSQTVVSGAPFTLKRLEDEHLVKAHTLSTAVHWRHRLEDWRFLLRLGRGVAAFSGDELVGTIMWWPFGERVARIGMVIVAPAMQRRGLGRRLMEAALEDVGARTLLLSATAEGLSLYEKLGFQPTGAIRQHQAASAVPGSHALREGSRLRPVSAGDMDALIALDERATGFLRAELLSALADVGEGLILERDDGIAAWSFFRRFGRGYVIGPVWARDEQHAKLLIATWIARHREHFLRIDVPASSGLSGWLEDHGLPCVSEEVVMTRGAAPSTATGAARTYALAISGLG